MKKDNERRLAALERPHKDAERKTFASAAAPILLAYYVGDLKQPEGLAAALARALEYENIQEFARDVAQAIESGSPELAKRSLRAYRRLYQMLGYADPATEIERDDTIVEMAEELPPRWQKFIRDSIREDIEVEKCVEEHWRNLESMVQEGAQ